MDKASELLVILVSAILSVFLIVSIVVVIKIMQVVRDLKHITEKAVKLADSAEAIGTFFQKSATPVAISKFLYNITESVLHHDKKNDKGRNE